MSDYRDVNCPSCKKKLPGRYRADVSSKQKTHGYCPWCNERYTVSYGNGSVKIVKGYE